MLLCLTFPSLVSTDLQWNSGGGSPSVAAVAQINMWFAVGGSIVGVFIANSLAYRKISVHDVVFISLAGAIAFSSSSSINFNPGAAIAIGSGIGFICALIHTPFKRWMNDGGVVESNSVIVQFLIPGIMACVFSSILQAINQGQFTLSVTIGATTTTSTYQNSNSGRDPSGQAGWQLMGFVFSLGSSLICGVILGLLFRALHRHRHYWYFNDLRWIDFGLDNDHGHQKYEDRELD